MWWSMSTYVLFYFSAVSNDNAHTSRVSSTYMYCSDTTFHKYNTIFVRVFDKWHGIQSCAMYMQNSHLLSLPHCASMCGQVSRHICNILEYGTHVCDNIWSIAVDIHMAYPSCWWIYCTATCLCNVSLVSLASSTTHYSYLSSFSHTQQTQAWVTMISMRQSCNRRCIHSVWCSKSGQISNIVT